MNRFVCALLIALAANNAMSQSPEPELIDRIIAIVGDDIVMLSELRAEVNALEQRLRQTGQDPSIDPAAVRKQAFDSLVMKKLQLAEAARLGIEADEQTVSRAVVAIADNNGMTVEQFRAALAAEGLDFETFRDSLRDEVVIRRLRQREVTQRIEVTRSEVDAYLERTGGIERRTAVHLLYILIEAPDDASPEQQETARVRAEQVAARLRSGEDFRSVARQVSVGQAAANGGDLGWLSVDRIPPLFQPYVAKMEVGELQGPIAAGRGYHLIRLEDVRGSASTIVRQTRARHILIRTNEVTSDTEAQRRLQQLRQRIVGGDDFETLARANSDDKASAINGGDLGWSTPGNLVPEFEEQMDALAIGEVSQPFESQFGWHIVQVLERRDYDATDEARRDQARQAIRDEKADEALRNYLRRLRDEAYIELRIDDIYQ
jgi:peptidyl-prolyl cis-trans isomerase SurA